MYTVVLMAALTTAVDMPERGGRRGGGGCCGCYGGGGGGWGGGCYGGMGGMGMGWGGCYGGMGGMGMGWGGCYGGMGGGYGGMRTSWGGWGYGNSGYALGNYSSGFGNYAYAPMMSTWGTPVVTAGGMNQWMQNPYQGYAQGAGAINLGTQSNYFSPAGANEATIIVHLPANASLSIDGQQTQQRSDRRVFTSPPLQSGKTYTYTIRAETTRDGRTVHETQNVDVQAGKTSEVRFNLETSNRGENLNEPAAGNREPARRTLPVPPPDR